MLSATERVAFDRGQEFKSYVRAAAALRRLYDDVALAEAVGRTRNAVGNWWTGGKPDPEAIGRLAHATGLSIEELTRFVYYDGPPPTLPATSGPSGLQEGRRRATEGLPAAQDPDMPSPSPGRRPRGAEAGHE